MTKIKIARLDSKDKDKIIEIFFAAFEQDPLMYYFFDHRYQNLATYVIQYMCDLASLLDLILLGAFVEEELQGVALVTPPEAAHQNKQEEIALLDEQLASTVGEDIILRTEKYFQLKEANKPKQPHFYLDILGVMPKSQSQGIGKALIEELHKMSEEHAQSCGVALDTENERNPDFYRRFGYSISTTMNLDTVKIWFMFRPNSI